VLKSTFASITVAGDENYEVTSRKLIRRKIWLIWHQKQRAHKGFFHYPVEIPGVSVTNFMRTAINETRAKTVGEEMPANEMLKLIRENQNIRNRP
jgi:Fe-S cluster assembly ATP-binding protein